MASDNYRFKAFGPFEVPVVKSKRSKKRKVDFATARDSVFNEAQALCGNHFQIKNAVGLYIFGLSPSGSAKTRPYYVGQACKQTLFDRVFQSQDKPRVYNGILEWYEKATPFIYLLPLLTPTSQLARMATESSKRRIDQAEYDLIGMALRSNPNLWNIQHRAKMESFVIEGTPMHKGAKSHAANRLLTMLNLAPPKKVAAKAGELPSPEFTAVTPEDALSVEQQPGGEIDTAPADQIVTGDEGADV